MTRMRVLVGAGVALGVVAGAVGTPPQHPGVWMALVSATAYGLLALIRRGNDDDL